MRAMVVAVAALVLSACGSASTPTAAPAATTASSCPGAGAPAVDPWPDSVPSTLPTFPGQQILTATTAGPRVTVTFTTPQSLRESVVSILKVVPAAGYVLGRGEAERVDAEAPFSDANVNGAFRVLEVDSCLSQWLLVLEPRSLFLQDATPLVTVSAHPSVSSSAFGG